MKILIRAVIYLLETRLEYLENKKDIDYSDRREIENVKSFIRSLEEEV